MSRNHYGPSSSSSGTSTPPQSLTSSNSWSIPASVTGLLRRFSTQDSIKQHASISTPPYDPRSNGSEGVYTPPYRTASPFQPPPLYPVILKGHSPNTSQSARLLTRALAEEIRLLVPPRLQLCEEWNLVYSLENDGVSLGTLYKKCEDLRRLRNGFCLVVKDGEGGLFGAYLTDAPHINPHYFGTGECFLWRATTLTSSLPPPPSADTEHLNIARSTTISTAQPRSPDLLSPTSTSSTSQSHSQPRSPLSPHSGNSSPDRIRFKAFPYSGINDYLILCEAGFLSLGGGDGKYGLWLDDSFERGVSSHCLTFGNEGLSEEGEKFDIIGVELWSIGNS